MPDQPVIIREADARPRGKGCFFWGCLSLVIIFLLMGGCVAIVTFTLVNKAKEFTDTVPAPVPAHEAAPGDLQGIERRLEAFEKAPSPAELEITAEDLNDLIASEQDFTGNVFARIEGGKVYFDASFPLSQFPPPISTLLGDRYFNGTLGLDLLIENQRLVARPVSAETAKNQKVDQKVLENISGDLFEEFLGPKLLEATKIAKGVEVQEGRIVIKK